MRSLLAYGLIAGLLLGCGGGDRAAPTAAPTSLLGASFAMAMPDSGSMGGSTVNPAITDSVSQVVTKVLSTTTVTLLAGGGTPGVEDGRGAAARFTNPRYITADAEGNFYVSDTGLNLPGFFGDPTRRAAIRKITPDGVVSTIAGSPSWGDENDVGTADGAGQAARFLLPQGLAFGADGGLYVADGLAATVRRIGADGVVSTFAGQAGRRTVVDGPGRQARFAAPGQMLVDAQGNLYLNDSALNADGRPDVLIRKISPTGEVSTLASHLPVGQANPALAIDPLRGVLYFLDADPRPVSRPIYSLAPDGQISDTGLAAEGPGSMLWMAPATLAVLVHGHLRYLAPPPG